MVYKPEENDKEIGVPFRMPSFSTWSIPGICSSALVTFDTFCFEIVLNFTNVKKCFIGKSTL